MKHRRYSSLAHKDMPTDKESHDEFVFNLMEKELDPYMGEGGSFVDMSDHRRWARDWQDRAKADAFEEAARALHIYADTSFDY